MKKCPFCEGDVSETAKKCKHCGEWIKENVSDSSDSIDMNDNKPQLNKGGKKTGSDTGKSQSKIQKILSDYGILLVILAVIVYALFLKPDNGVTDADNDISKYSKDNNSEYIVAEKSWDGVKATEMGFLILPNEVGECYIGDDDIENFVDAVGKASDGEVIDWTCKNQSVSIENYNYGSNIAFLFDNSYSQDLNGNIDKKGPNNRMGIIQNYLINKGFSNGTILDFVFMFTLKPEDNSEEPDGNLYHFLIDNSKFKILYVKEGDGKPFYDDKRNTLIFRNIKLSTSLSGGNKSECIVKSNYDFICYDAGSVYERIYEIYKKEYDFEGKHTNNMFMKTLAMNKDRFYGGDKDEIYVFTNGEFKIGYERENMYLSKLKQKYKDQWKHDGRADRTHNLTEFNMRYANWYQKDSKYESFWLEAIDTLRSQLPVCEGTKIHIIGLTRSAEFKPLAEKIYSKIFEPCEVLFQ